ncbi:MFS transporter [Dermacoccus abyssi]|uniref:MFS transporter n=1 Tax=Dermacoccus abyssi TaxID=322596 RepID=A0ABX5Z8U7_9MICO|nr:MFS transporter [Dermacoccus abyssi]
MHLARQRLRETACGLGLGLDADHAHEAPLEARQGAPAHLHGATVDEATQASRDAPGAQREVVGEVGERRVRLGVQEREEVPVDRVETKAQLADFSQGGAWGWGDVKTLVAIVVGVVVLVLWAKFELGHTSPIRRPARLRHEGPALHQPRVDRHRHHHVHESALDDDDAAGPASEKDFGWDAASAGLAMLPNAAAMFAVAPLTARLGARFGARTVLQIVAIVTGLGYLLRAVASPNPAMVIIWATVIGVGVGIGYAALSMLVVEHAPLREMGSANAVNALMRAIGTAVSSAGVATIAASMSVMVGGRTVPSAAALTTMAFIGVGLSALTYVLAAAACDRKDATAQLAG